jgi:hypothetical protein
MEHGGRMAEKILMGQKELLRSKVLEMVKREKMALKQAAGQLKGISKN